MDKFAKAFVAAKVAGATALEMALTAEEYFATAREAIDAVELDRVERFSASMEELSGVVTSVDEWFDLIESSVVDLDNGCEGFLDDFVVSEKECIGAGGRENMPTCPGRYTG